MLVRTSTTDSTLKGSITILGELGGAHKGRDGEHIPGADRKAPNAAGASAQSGSLVFYMVSIRWKCQVSAGIFHLLAVSLETTLWSLLQGKPHRTCSGHIIYTMKCEVLKQ